MAEKKGKNFKKVYILAEYGISAGGLPIVDVSTHLSKDNLGGNHL